MSVAFWGLLYSGLSTRKDRNASLLNPGLVLIGAAFSRVDICDARQDDAKKEFYQLR